MGRWLEEGEEIVVHPRDPYHRVDVLATDRHIRVSLDGELLAETDAGAGAVRVQPADALVHPARGRASPSSSPVDTVTRCPYKGTAGYYSVLRRRRGGQDLIWYYEEPLAEVGRIKACCASSTRRSTSSSTATSVGQGGSLRWQTGQRSCQQASAVWRSRWAW